jgi:hypothetical protein
MTAHVAAATPTWFHVLRLEVQGCAGLPTDTHTLAATALTRVPLHPSAAAAANDCSPRHRHHMTPLPQLVAKIVRGQPAPLPLRYSAGIRDLVGELLSKDPHARPSANSGTA